MFCVWQYLDVPHEEWILCEFASPNFSNMNTRPGFKILAWALLITKEWQNGRFFPFILNIFFIYVGVYMLLQILSCLLTAEQDQMTGLDLL